MSPVQASCPGCGGPVPFPVGSVVVVCPYCRSVVARGDRGVEDLGKVADLIETASPLAVGLRGRFQSVPFELTGRAQLGHAAGGVWDEWYARFADGRWGWLAEAQGRFYLTFQQQGRLAKAPAFANLQPGRRLTLGAGVPPLVIAETGRARAVSAEGAIPWRFTPGDSYCYADLSGPAGEFATLDYSEEPPLVFLGREVELGALGVLPTDLRRPRSPRQIEGIQLNCPNCGGALTLRAPDKTERVTCPSCNSLLDVQQGQLSFLKALEPGRVKPSIPLGHAGTWEGQTFTVIGFLERSVTVEQVRYPWYEYLLYHPDHGFRWLVQSEGHWNYVKPLAPGQVHGQGNVAEIEGRKFKLFQRGDARVDHVSGEFYWKVHVGEHAATVDLIRPPEMLSREASTQDGATEVAWSLGAYQTAADIERAFGVTGLPRPASGSVAPNQPFPYKKIYKYWAFLTLGAMAAGLACLLVVPRRKVLDERVTLPATATADQGQEVFTQPFELKGGRNVRVQIEAPQVENTWLEVDGDLVNEDTNLVQPFSTAISYYHGVDGGESWTEGSRHSWTYLSRLPAGRYVLRLDAQWESWNQPMVVRVLVEQGVPRLLYWGLTLLALAVIPACVAVYHLSFERRRWADSDYSPFASTASKVSAAAAAGSSASDD